MRGLQVIQESYLICFFKIYDFLLYVTGVAGELFIGVGISADGKRLRNEFKKLCCGNVDHHIMSLLVT